MKDKVKKPFYKRIWVWVIVLLLIIGVGSSQGKSTGSSSSSSSSSSTAKAASANSTTSKVKVISNTAVTTDLTTGSDYVVGKDIKAGTYDITTDSGSGNVMSKDGRLNIILSAPADANSDLSLTSYHAILKDGETIEIDSIPSVHFQASTSPTAISNGNLNAGDYVVGQDIAPGRYTLALVAGSGNVQTNDYNVNEIFNSDSSAGGVSSTTVTLHTGEVLSFDVQTISLTKK
ncbi:hypothetical protein ESZ50_10075 [Weissella muntiaci]|uniref:Uncharacterized protein n=1 Tax=Weissella muntiaci TaxID=2508881 RepID=A0A6C2C223_9LACO|nr:hypothetical protein [Weissella muntiaci]TYC48110.1 hypothetical protein ESZ50_10075 [Weissella muntiaci]